MNAYYSIMNRNKGMFMPMYLKCNLLWHIHLQVQCAIVINSDILDMVYGRKKEKFVHVFLICAPPEWI